MEELPNGNFLVTDNPGKHGHAFEVTRDKEVVWEWVNPYRSSDGKPLETYQVLRLPRETVAGFVDGAR